MSFVFQVVGAGVAGLSVASELSQRGASVRLYDRNGPPGPHACSWWAGGMLAPFCEGESAEEPVMRWGQLAADWWESKGASVKRNGSLVLALGRDQRELDRFSRRTHNHHWLKDNDLLTLEPELGGRFTRALYFPEEAHLDPRQALGALTQTLREQNVEIITSEGHFIQHAIDCRGLTAQDQLSDLRGVKGEMLVLRCPELTFNRPIRLLHPRIPIYLVPRGEGVYMLGATMLESNDRRRATVRSVLELLSSAYALHPAFGEAEIIEIGVDARPAFPDNLPRLRIRNGILFVNGLYRHGFLLAPTLARMTADYLLEKKIPEFLDAN